MDDSKICRNAHKYEDRTVRVEGELQHVPKFSQWEYVCRCCGGRCNLVYFPVIKRYFCNQWECNLLYPVCVSFFVTVSFAFSIVAIIQFLHDPERIIMLVLTCLFYLLWVTSYFMAVCSSPGYLPFYWAVEKKEVFTFEQQMDGVITTQEQYDFAAYNGRPERGSFSRQARRLVLKADHICKWIANWVGLKNYRYFFLKVLWAMIFFIDWFVVFILMCIELKDNWVVKVGNIAMFVAVLPMFGFFVFICQMFVRHVDYTTHNTSTLQEFKAKRNPDKHNYYDLGCWNNCVQVFGPASYCPIWFFPIRFKRKWGGFEWKTNRRIPKSEDEVEEDVVENSSDFDDDEQLNNEPQQKPNPQPTSPSPQVNFQRLSTRQQSINQNDTRHHHHHEKETNQKDKKNDGNKTPQIAAHKKEGQKDHHKKEEQPKPQRHQHQKKDKNDKTPLDIAEDSDSSVDGIESAYD